MFPTSLLEAVEFYSVQAQLGRSVLSLTYHPSAETWDAWSVVYMVPGTIRSVKISGHISI